MIHNVWDTLEILGAQGLAPNNKKRAKVVAGEVSLLDVAHLNQFLTESVDGIHIDFSKLLPELIWKDQIGL